MDVFPEHSVRLTETRHILWFHKFPSTGNLCRKFVAVWYFLVTGEDKMGPSFSYFSDTQSLIKIA